MQPDPVFPSLMRSLRLLRIAAAVTAGASIVATAVAALA
jgi:hypothetical protein